MSSVHDNTIQELPSSLPVMVLSGVTLFPNALLPLFIFEPRYRVMLEEVLGTDRMLALAMPKSDTEHDLEAVAGAGLVRACIRNADGTSNLILQGVSRVCFAGWEQDQPYRIASIQKLDSTGNTTSDWKTSEEMDLQLTRLHALCARFKEHGMELPSQFEAYLNQITNVGVITDLVASTLVADPFVRQELLAELHIPTRLNKLIKELRKQLG
jgi:Lon protease-like protein